MHIQGEQVEFFKQESWKLFPAQLPGKEPSGNPDTSMFVPALGDGAAFNSEREHP